MKWARRMGRGAVGGRCVGENRSGAIPAKTLSVFLLAMMTLAIISGITNSSAIARAGLASVTLLVAAALFTMLPTGLCVAELGTSWPHDGGVYLWGRLAFGPRTGFVVVWFQWVANTIVLTTSLSFTAAALAMVLGSALSSSPSYVYGVVVAYVWIGTFINMFGVRETGRFSSVGVILSIVIPATLIVGFAVAFIVQSKPSAVSLDLGALVPDLSNSSTLPAITATATSFFAIEVTAVFVRQIRNPERNYPIAIGIAGLIAAVLMILVTLSIVVTVPQSKLNIVSGFMESLQVLLGSEGVGFLVVVIGALIAVGWMGRISSILLGLATGLLGAARYGHLPKSMSKVNKKDAPRNLLVAQAAFITIVASPLAISKHVQNGFWLLIVLATAAFLMEYIIIYACTIKLRYKRPRVPRPFSVPGGKVGIWIVAGGGILVSLAIFALGFIAPTSTGSGGAATYEVSLIIGLIVIIAIPFALDRRGRAEVVQHVGTVQGADDQIFLDDTSDLPVVEDG